MLKTTCITQHANNVTQHNIIAYTYMYIYKEFQRLFHLLVNISFQFSYEYVEITIMLTLIYKSERLDLLFWLHFSVCAGCSVVDELSPTSVCSWFCTWISHSTEPGITTSSSHLHPNSSNSNFEQKQCVCGECITFKDRQIFFSSPCYILRHFIPPLNSTFLTIPISFSFSRCFFWFIHWCVIQITDILRHYRWEFEFG